MFPIILIMSIFCQGQTTDYGTEFVTAFPENLAYYYPAPLTLTLKITTLIEGTNIDVFLNGQNIKNLPNCPTAKVHYVPITNGEVNQIGPSGNVVRIVSDNNITVYSFSMRGDSVQTNVVLPTRNLGMKYVVPSFNYTDLAVRLNTYNVSQFIDTTTVPMDFSFRLLIINAEAVNNTVTVTQTTAGGSPTDTVITIGPYSLNQLPSDDSYVQVSSTGKVAVILTNPCIDTLNCKCNMVAHQLRPTSLLGNSFLYIYYNAAGMGLFVASDSNVDVTSGSQKSSVSPGSIAMLPYFPGLSTGSTILTTSQSASVNVIYPGLIVELLPTTRFAGCYLVHSTAGTSSSMALIIAQTGVTGNIYMGSSLLSVPNWNALNDTGFTYALVSLSSGSNVIWHPSSPIGVYILETSKIGVTFGGPAIVLNDEPDPNGCVVVPIPFVLSNNSMTWQASRAFCASKNMVLASPNLEFTQHKMVQSLINMNAAGDVWLGMRRNLTTSDWYWNSDDDITFTNWNNNEPSSGMCVSLTVDHSANFKWNTDRCCTAMQPLCEGKMVTLSSINDPNTQSI